MTDASGMTTYTYTDRDQVATKQTPQGTLTYTYDPGGDVLTTVSSNANGTDVAYAYDGNNRLASVTDNRTGGATTYSYDATNQVDFFTYANGVKHDFAYDDRDRITDLDLTLASSPLASYSLNYSDSGRIDDVAENSGRYPEDLFSIQADQYRTFHMTAPQVFYNREDLWVLPNENYAGTVAPMKPYYILMKLPGSDKLEYLMMTPFTPQKRDNMISWMAAKSDLPDYGKMLRGAGVPDGGRHGLPPAQEGHRDLWGCSGNGADFG